MEAAEEAAQIAVSLDRERYGVGDTVLVTATISNPTGGSISSSLVLSITADSPLSMRFPDQNLQTFEDGVTIAPGSSKTITKSYELPASLSSDDNYFVEATYGNSWAIVPFVLDPSFEWAILLPPRVEKGVEFVASLTITNSQATTLENISVTLELPMELDTQTPLEQSVPILGSTASETLTWNLVALSKSEVAQVVFAITSDNGGSYSAFRGVEVYLPRQIYLPSILRDH
jgi:hypothetical protein